MFNKNLQAKTRQQLANEFGVTPRTLRRWFKSKNIDLPRTLITPKSLSEIYSVFGNPSEARTDQGE